MTKTTTPVTTPAAILPNATAADIVRAYGVDPLVSEDTLAELCAGLSASSRARLRREGKFPPLIKITTQRKGARLSEVARYLADPAGYTVTAGGGTGCGGAG